MSNIPSLAEYHPELLQEVAPEAHEEKQNNSLLYGSMNILGVRIPNLILLIAVLVIAYFAYQKYGMTTHKLGPAVGGALDSSASPGSGSFLRSLNIN